MFAATGDKSRTVLDDCLLDGRPADIVTFGLVENFSFITTEEGVTVNGKGGQSSCNLNAAAALVLSYCDAEHTIGEIAAQVAPYLPARKRSNPYILVLNTLWHLRALNLINVISPAPPRSTAAQLEATPLREVHLFLTRRCPLRCVHCCIPPDHPLEITTTQIVDLLKQLQIMGLPKVTFTGGEPLCRGDFYLLAETARSFGMDFNLATSGATIDRETAARIAALAPLSVNISLYGAEPDIHDRITRVPGSWRRSMAAIDHLMDLGVPVSLKCTVMDMNYDTYAGISNLAKTIGLKAAFDPGIICRLDGDPAPLKHRITPEQLNAFARTPFWRKTGCQESAPTDRPCHAATGRCAIDADGAVYPCVLFPLLLGSATEKPLHEILCGPAARRIRSLTIGDLSHCATCCHLEHCTPCPGLAYSEHGDYRHTSEWCCAMAQAEHQMQADRSSDKGERQ